MSVHLLLLLHFQRLNLLAYLTKTITSRDISTANHIADDLDMIPRPNPVHLHDLLDLHLLAHLFHDNVPHLCIPKPDGLLPLNVADPLAKTEPDTIEAEMNVAI